MLPAVAGAAVPIYNIPELVAIGQNLVLGRTIIASIFKGDIRYWNDSRILNVNPTAVKQVLQNIGAPITVVVREDSSGTSDIFSTALSLFDPGGVQSPDYSWATVVGHGEKPNWCGALTDEIQVIATSNCNSTASSAAKTIHAKLVDTAFHFRDTAFECDDSAANVKSAFESVFGHGSILVTRSVLSSTSFAFTIGYFGAPIRNKNKYEPFLYGMTAPVSATVSTKQEGGFWNSHYNSSAFLVTAESQSIWIDKNSTAAFTFSNGNPGQDSSLQSPVVTNVPQTDMSSAIRSALSSIAQYLVTKVTRVAHGSNWDEYRLTFNSTKPNPSKPKPFIVNDLNTSIPSLVGVSTFLHASNYPLFYDAAHPAGFQSSGKYTCYRHDHNLTAWSYYTGQSNLGVVAAVKDDWCYVICLHDQFLNMYYFRRSRTSRMPSATRCLQTRFRAISRSRA